MPKLKLRSEYLLLVLRFLSFCVRTASGFLILKVFIVHALIGQITLKINLHFVA